MVAVKRPTTPMTSSPPSSDEWEDVQQHAIPLPDAMEALREIAAAHDERKADNDGGGWSLETGKQFLDATVGTTLDAAANLHSKVKGLPGKVSLAQAIRMTTRRCSIKFVAVIGLTGAGKSSIIKTLTGEDVHVEHSIHTGTTTFAMFPTIIDDQRYILIDTPGFNDKVRTDMEVFEEILKWFHTMTPYCDLAGILYVHDITSKRFNNSADLNLAMLEALCGEKFFKKVTILTTMWSDMKPSAVKAAEKRQKEFEQDAWKALIAGGAQVFPLRHGVAEPEDPINEEEKDELEKERKLARKELEEVMAYYKTSERVTPRIQKELRAKVDIWSTEAGAVLRKSSNLPPAPNQMDNSGTTALNSPSCPTMDNNGTTALNSPSCPTNDSSAIPQSSPSPAETTDSGNETPTPQTQEKPGKSKESVGEGPPPESPWFMRLLKAVAWFFLRRRS